MAIAALIVAVVSALAAVGAVVYARRLDDRAKAAVSAAGRSADAAERSATAAERSAAAAEQAVAASERSAMASEERAALEGERRHSELTPMFRVSVALPNPGAEGLALTVVLVGPSELRRLDSLTVRIRDDRPGRADEAGRPGGPSPEEVAAQIWGPYRFVPGTGPGASPGSELGAADATGRVTSTAGMPVGESLRFALEPTTPPRWSSLLMEQWRQQVGTRLRLELEAQRAGRGGWTLVCELRTPDLMAPGSVIADV